jgi:putative SOS response-associated peptidase YedK
MDLLTCTILTRGANSVVQPFHHRMPVIIDQPEVVSAWLSETPPSLDELVRVDNSDQLIAYPASRRVNNSRYEGPDCLTAD